MGTTGPASIDPATGRAYGARLPARDHPRHGAGAGDAARPARHPRPVPRASAARWAACRCCNGRRATPSGSSPRCRSPPAPRHSAQNIAFHEVGRQAIMADPAWARGALPRGGHAARPRASASPAWARTSPTCRSRPCTASSAAASRTASAPTFSFDADFQIESYLRHQGLELRRALRRQLLPLPHPGDGLFRPRGRPWRRAGQGLQGHQDAVLRDLLHLRLAVSDRRIPAPSCMR